MSKTVAAVTARLPAMRILIILLAGQAMASMDASILAVAAPSLRSDLHASDAQLQMVIAMYTIAFAALVVCGARLGDVLGRERAFRLGLAGFTLASLACGLAPTADALVVARGLQGAAGALMTPQILSIIHARFEDERRARAIGAYSLILAVGVAAGQVVGGLVVSAHLLPDAWRPALLLNVPIGVLVMVCARRGLPASPMAAPRRLDFAGSAVLSVALLALVLPLTFGRDAGWPVWVWPSLAGGAAALAAFAAVEQRVRARGGDPLFDLDVLATPNVGTGVLAVTLLMGSYTGFLLSLTLHLQDGLGFTALRAGLTFATYATGFAVASLTWTRVSAALRPRLPVAGPLVMGIALLGVGLIARDGDWPVGATSALLFAAGAGHACGFSPLTHRLVSAVRAEQAGDISALVLTASLAGSVIGTAGVAGVYFAAAPQGSGQALVVTTAVLASVLLLTAACANRTLAAPRPAAPTVVASQTRP